jgi:dipeptidyl aminopeptidase/acylaminoacyl peptidase
MKRYGIRQALLCAVLGCVSVAAVAAVPTLEAFFTGAQIHSVSISPDGKSLAMIVVADGKEFVAVKDRGSPTPAVPVLAKNDKDGFHPQWCHWANNERIVCSFWGRERDKYRNKVFEVTRLVAVNKDGSQQKQLLQNPFDPNGSGQINDRVIDWTPEDPRTVLIDKRNPYAPLRVLKLDIYTGETKTVEDGQIMIGGFGTDGHGNVRLGWGQYQLKNYYFAKLKGETKWRELARVGTLSTDEGFEPIAVIPDTNYAYALRDHEGRQALWKIDLSDKEDPQLVFASSRVDVRPTYTPNNQVLAVLPDSGSKEAYYVEPSAELLGEVLGRMFKDKIYGVLDMSADFKTVVVEAESDVMAPQFFVLDMAGAQPQLQRVGSRFPGLDKTDLAKMESISYPARDGTPVPAFLSKPVNATGLPALVIMPHGGPWARDRWGFDGWVQVLAREGYAVLQANYRGSDGYGKKWREASYKNWGDLPYTDTVDGIKWAIAQKLADPSRICVVGGSFGGYMALSVATRDSPLIKCAVAVAGVSDLQELKSDAGFFVNHLVVEDMIGSDVVKLRQDSPRFHADGIAVPVLMVHGDEDFTVEPDQSEFMAKAMDVAKKPYKLVMVHDTDHYFREQDKLREMFTAITDFLRVPLAAAAN